MKGVSSHRSSHNGESITVQVLPKWSIPYGSSQKGTTDPLPMTNVVSQRKLGTHG